MKLHKFDDALYEKLRSPDYAAAYLDAAKEDGIEKSIIPVNCCAAIIRNSMTDEYLKLHRNEDKGIFAITLGSRMIPKIL
jgi:hypothetical protein